MEGVFFRGKPFGGLRKGSVFCFLGRGTLTSQQHAKPKKISDCVRLSALIHTDFKNWYIYIYSGYIVAVYPFQPGVALAWGVYSGHHVRICFMFGYWGWFSDLG